MNEQPLLPADGWQAIGLGQQTQFAANGIVSRTVFRSGSHRVVLFGFSGGQELSEHTSSSHALVQILSGQSEWTVNGERRVLKAGDLLHMPPHLRHAVRAIEPFSMLLTLLPAEAPPVPRRFADAPVANRIPVTSAS